MDISTSLLIVRGFRTPPSLANLVDCTELKKIKKVSLQELGLRL